MRNVRAGTGRLENDDMNLLGLQPEWEVFRDTCRGFHSGQTSNPSCTWKKSTLSK